MLCDERKFDNYEIENDLVWNTHFVSEDVVDGVFRVDQVGFRGDSLFE